MEEAEESPELSTAKEYLNSLLNRTLRIHTTDTRMFLGQFKCTDSDRNIILSQTFEYRLPSPNPTVEELEAAGQEKIRKDMSSRYLGLVVVPGEYITRIEVEEFVSQMKGKGKEKLDERGLEEEREGKRGREDAV